MGALHLCTAVRSVRRDAGCWRQPYRSPTRLEVLESLRKSRTNRRVTPALLREVADVYRDALADGRHPTREVKDHYFVSERQAGNYVQRARAAGFLAPTTPGKKGG